MAAFILKKLNLLRVPPEVEVEGLDFAEYEGDYLPEVSSEPDMVFEPDGKLVAADKVLAAAAKQVD